MDINHVILGPVITEKSMREAGRGKFTFAVIKSATKTAIKKAISGGFNVNVIAVQTTIVKGKTKRTGAKRLERDMSVWKKAIVTLKQGEKIDIFEAAGTNPGK